MKRKSKYIVMLLCIFTILFGIGLPTKADSGWDSSYDSGGSWDSGDSSWDSGSSDWGSSNGSYISVGTESDGFGFADLAIIIIFVVIIVISIANQNKKAKLASSRPKTIINSRYCKEMSEEEFNNAIKDITMEELRQEVFNTYKNIQYAWTNFDYDRIRMLTTDEIFNMYSSQLNTLEIKNQVNIMSEIEKNDVRILSVKKENGINTIEAYLKVNCYDYVINKATNQIVRGINDRKMELEYIITLVKDANSSNKNTVICPNCGAEVEMTAGGKCKYCDAVLVQKASDYVMSKKECIGQKVL